MFTISVIVAIYNQESLLDRFLKSLSAQTFQNVEFILVDDGSTDSSFSICKEYAEKDYRYRIVRKDNGGLTSARKAGLAVAKGDYVLHVDSDDWLEPDMLSILYDSAKKENADLVICDFWEEYKSKRRKVSMCPDGTEHAALLKQFVSGKLQRQVWTKLIRRSFFVEYDLMAPNFVGRWEDVYMICKLAQHDIKVSYVPKPLYHYDLFSNPISLVRYCSKKGFYSQRYVTDIICTDLKGNLECTKVCFEMKAQTKSLAFSIPEMTFDEYLRIYEEYNSDFIKRLYKLKGFTSILEAMSLLFKTRFFRSLYFRLKNLMLN